MKKWIVIVVVIGLFGWAAYDFLGKSDNEETESNVEEVTDDSEKPTSSGPKVGIEKGNLAPDFELETLDGEQVKLSDYRGEKVMLNFWATWCPPCRAEMPDMQKFHEDDEEGVILAVNLLETEQSGGEGVKPFLEEYGITFTVLSDAETKVANIYNANQLPTSYLIDSDGIIHNKAIGPLNYEMMVQVFEEMN